MIKLAVPYCLILICLLFSQRSSAQSIDTSKFKYLEVGIGMMAVNYSGDLAENHIIPEQTSFGANIFARYHLSKLIQLRGNLGVSYLHGDDKHSPTHAWRSFKFTNTVIDVGAYLELNILRIPFEPIGPTNRSYLMAYGLVGPSLVFSKPTAEYDGLPTTPTSIAGFQARATTSGLTFPIVTAAVSDTFTEAATPSVWKAPSTLRTTTGSTA